MKDWRGERKQADVIGRNVLDLDGGRYSAYETGRMRPGLDVAARIAKITRGAVPIDAWLLPPKPEKSAKSARRAA